MKNSKIGYFIIGSAIIWGAVILGCAFALKGTECYQRIQIILFFGVVSHLLFIWGPLQSLIKKDKENK
ncbi:hypothetical protein ACFL5D_04705 [Candidatus Neomarinimicrobiota bacterium]